jgi:transcription elongation factor SPT6
MKSNRGIHEFNKPEQQLTRYLVSLARKVQDPVTEYASLMNTDDDYKHLILHPLQKLVPEEKLKKSLERSFMNVVASW